MVLEARAGSGERIPVIYCPPPPPLLTTHHGPALLWVLLTHFLINFYRPLEYIFST